MKIRDYARRLGEERKHFRRILGQDSNQGLVAAPPVWNEVEAVMARRIQVATGQPSGVDCIVAELERRPSPRLLSLGAGSCALELQWILPALTDPSSCRLECVDLDEELIASAAARAAGQGIDFAASAQDVNQLALEPDAYDVILCWASLHHFTELDHIAAEINRALKPGGVFITMDICSRNGFLLWPETKRVVDDLWRLLPESHRVAMTLGPKPVVCDEYPNVDCARSGFECICSEDILPALERNLERQAMAFAHTLMRRFFDTMFGGNFDLARPFDRAFFDIVRDYDEMAVDMRRLRPETFFAVYRKRRRPADLQPRPLDDIFFAPASA